VHDLLSAGSVQRLRRCPVVSEADEMTFDSISSDPGSCDKVTRGGGAKRPDQWSLAVARDDVTRHVGGPAFSD
jgi:hypothetical protein